MSKPQPSLKSVTDSNSTPPRNDAATVHRYQHTYPRSKVPALVRWLCLRPWALLTGVYLPNVGWGLFSRWEHVGHLTWTDIWYQLLAERVIPALGTEPLLVLLILAACLAYPLSRWAQNDLKREKEAIKPNNGNGQFSTFNPSEHIQYRPPQDPLTLPDPYVERPEELDRLLSRFERGETKVAVYGLEGSGKKTLVHAVITRLKQEGHFQEGVVILERRYLDEPGRALQRLLARFDSLQRPPDTCDLDTLQPLAQQLLRGRDVVVILQDVPEQFEIAPAISTLAAAGVTVVITTCYRVPDTVIPRRNVLVLGALTRDQAVELFALAQHGTLPDAMQEMDRRAATEIVDLLGHHPYTVHLIASAALAEQRDLRSLASELRDDPALAVQTVVGVTPYGTRFALGKSVGALSSDAHNLLVALAIFPTGDFSREAANALTQGVGLLPSVHLRPLIVRYLLLPYRDGADGAERFRMYPIVRAYAMRQVKQWQIDQPRLWQRCYLVLARHYAKLLGTDPDQVLRLDEDNVLDVLDVVSVMTQQDASRTAIIMSAQLGDYWTTRSSLDESERRLKLVASQAVRRRLDPLAEDDRVNMARVLSAFAEVLERRGKYTEAADAYRESLGLGHAPADLHPFAMTHIALCRVSLAMVPFSPANVPAPRDVEAQILDIEARIEEARRLVNPMRPDLVLEASALNLLGLCYLARHNSSVAERNCTKAFDLVSDPSPATGAEFWRTRGDIAFALADIHRCGLRFQQAYGYCAAALQAYLRANDYTSEARALYLAGALAVARGLTSEAIDYFRDALQFALRFGDARITERAASSLRVLDASAASAELGEIVAARRRSGIEDVRGSSIHDTLEGLNALQYGDLDTAEQRLLSALEEAAGRHDARAQAMLLYDLAQVKQRQGYYVTVQALRRRSVEQLVQAESQPRISALGDSPTYQSTIVEDSDQLGSDAQAGDSSSDGLEGYA